MNDIVNKFKNKKTASKAVQVAFELEEQIASEIRKQAATSGLTPSDQIRKILGLEYSAPKRPRLTISLSEEDYTKLGEIFAIEPSDKIQIKKSIVNALITYFQ